MKFMSWLRERLNGKVGDRDAKFAEAVAATDGVAVTARSLREQLEPYRRADDPFAAMTRALHATRSFQDTHDPVIYHGPPH